MNRNEKHTARLESLAAALRRKPHTARKLAETFNVTRQAIYDQLEELERRGFPLDRRLPDKWAKAGPTPAMFSLPKDA